jgi:hypothetical protein
VGYPLDFLIVFWPLLLNVMAESLSDSPNVIPVFARVLLKEPCIEINASANLFESRLPMLEAYLSRSSFTSDLEHF